MAAVEIDGVREACICHRRLGAARGEPEIEPSPDPALPGTALTRVYRRLAAPGRPWLREPQKF